MKLIRQGGAILAATALAFASVTLTASAAPLTVTVADDTIAPGGMVSLSITGCPMDERLMIVLNGEIVDTVTVAASPTKFDIAYDKLSRGEENHIHAECQPKAGGATAGQVDVYAFGDSWIEADPQSFKAGQNVTISAGDFAEGASVLLSVYPANDDARKNRVFSKVLGVAGDDFAVEGDVVFPTSIPCGEYDVVLADSPQSNRLEGQLRICGDTATATATATATSTASATATATATKAPSKPGKPGLPHTGN